MNVRDKKILFSVVFYIYKNSISGRKRRQKPALILDYIRLVKYSKDLKYILYILHWT